jgi:glycosyltransferase involved in cell wall biosynthesis
MDMPYLKITVIIAVYNGEKHLISTIESIVNQSYPHLELIIIDGGSTDGSVDIIKKYEDKIAYWISEPDKGISDAFNKGVGRASGDYINFQGDGDGFLTPNSLEKLFKEINCKDCKFISARISREDALGNVEYISKPIKKFKKSSLLFRMSLPHQGLFTHKSYFEEYGLFDIDNTYCMDYEHLLRSYKNFPKVCTSDLIVARWCNDGLGNGKEREILREYHQIKLKNNVKPRPVLILINAWIVMKFYVKKVLGRV